MQKLCNVDACLFCGAHTSDVAREGTIGVQTFSRDAPSDSRMVFTDSIRLPNQTPSPSGFVQRPMLSNASDASMETCTFLGADSGDVEVPAAAA